LERDTSEIGLLDYKKRTQETPQVAYNDRIRDTPLQSILKKTPSIAVNQAPLSSRKSKPQSYLLYETPEKAGRIQIKKGFPLHRNSSLPEIQRYENPEIFTNYPKTNRKIFQDSIKYQDSLKDRMQQLKSMPKPGFASTAATPHSGTNVGFDQRLSENLSRAHLNRDVNYGKI